MALYPVKFVFEEMFKAIDLVLGSNLHTPALILAYTLIDIAGWLDSNHESVRVRFTSWVDKYVLPDTTLTCSSIDLYGARCGFIHSYSATSDLSSSQKASKIFYAWLPSKVNDQMDLITLNKELEQKVGGAANVDDIVAIQGDDFIQALKNGVEKFVVDMTGDPKKSNEVNEKAANLMTNLPESSVQELMTSARSLLNKV